ncbi:glycoside hydrolase family 3 N-terminal domain-containing protein [Pseudarthrobacter sp. NPDC058329]|uniref:glycoside hydrolase family 3 N-terminal domain-containing protein n=1 Tax=Pseudarthrobacter sp. NPDC058329 TaxID=3346448 RepID=UPI0036DCED45
MAIRIVGPEQRSETAEAFIEELLAAMTWEQKLAQLQTAFRPRLEDAKDLAKGGIGAVFWPRSAEATNELQRTAHEETPHGIPLLVGLDVVHGQRTTFPVPLAQAASFDPAVAEADARISAKEAACRRSGRGNGRQCCQRRGGGVAVSRRRSFRPDR